MCQKAIVCFFYTFKQNIDIEKGLLYSVILRLWLVVIQIGLDTKLMRIKQIRVFFWGGFLFIFLINVKCFVNLIAIFYEIFWFVWIFLYAHKITYWDNIETLNREYSRFLGPVLDLAMVILASLKWKNARIIIEIAMFRHFSWFY